MSQLVQNSKNLGISVRFQSCIFRAPAGMPTYLGE